MALHITRPLNKQYDTTVSTLYGPSSGYINNGVNQGTGVVLTDRPTQLFLCNIFILQPLTTLHVSTL